MASFTDAISQFNPYVQQLPVDAMVKVGMQKQAQYDQGVQKIQSYIDNVAGLEIAHESDKEYLQSKLGELGNRLKTVAAGDFSNQQLVNSVGGMAGQIMKDKNIENAVYSTANMKKQNEIMEADRKKGNLDKAGEYIYNKEAEEYLSNKEVGQKFNGKYSGKLSDWSKKILDAVKGIHSSATQEDIVRAYNPATGQFDADAFAAVMQRNSKEIVNPGQIRSVINAVLDTNDLEQMRKDGIYNYRGIDANAFIQNQIGNFDATKKLYQKHLDILEKDRETTTNAEKLLQIDEQIEDYRKALGDPSAGIPGTLQQDLSSTIALASTPKGLDQAKANTFLQNTIAQYSNAFAWAHIKNEVMTSPIEQNRLDVNAANLNAKAQENLQASRAFDQRMAIRADQRATTAEAREQAKYEKEQSQFDANGNPVFSGRGNETEQESEAVIAFNNETKGIIAQKNATFKALQKELGGYFSDADASSVMKKIQDYKTNPAKNPADNPKIASLMDQFIAKEREEKLRQGIYSSSFGRAEQDVLGKGVTLAKKYSKDVSKLPSLTIPLLNGKKQVVTPTELLAYLGKEKEGIVASKSHEGQDRYYRMPGDDLTPKEKIIAQYLRNRYVSKENANSVGYRNTGNKVIDNLIGAMQPSVNGYKNDLGKIYNQQIKVLQPVVGPYKTESAGIRFTEKAGDTRKSLGGLLLSQVLADATQKGGDIKYDTETSKTILSDPENANYGVVRQGNSYFIEVTGTGKDNKSEDTQLIPVSAEFIRKNIGPGYLNKAVEEQRMLFSSGGKTNPTNSIDLAVYTPNTFGHVKNGKRSVTLPIYADPIDLGSGNMGVKFHLQHPVDKKRVMHISWPDANTAIATFPGWAKSLNDQQLLAQLRLLDPNVDAFLNSK